MRCGSYLSTYQILIIYSQTKINFYAQIISGPENSPEIENDFYNFEALGFIRY